MSRLILLGALVAALLVVAGCGGGGSGAPAAEGVTLPDRSINVSEHDPGLVAAKVEADKHWPEFVESFGKRPAGLSHEVLVKFRSPDGQVERDWVTVTAIGENSVTGTLASDPETEIGYAYGDEVTVNRGLVDDWVIALGNKVEHGYFSHDAVMGVYGG